MRSKVRVSPVALLVSAFAAVAALAPAMAQAAESPGIEKFAAVNCSEGHEQCAHETVTINLGPPFEEQHYSVTKEPKTAAEAEAEGELRAGAHVPFGVTDFKVATSGSLPTEVPSATVKHIRTDVAPGLATSPAAVPMCSNSEFGKEELPESGLFSAPACSESTKIGVNQVTVYVAKIGIDLALEGFAYNLEQPAGRASDYGVAIKLPIPITKGELKEAFAAHPLEIKGKTKTEDEEAEEFFEAKQWYSHTLIEGNVEWGKEAKGTSQGDYHDYFEINVSTALPLISSRLVFYGRSGEGDFIANATSCPGHNTTILALTDLENQTVKLAYTTPVGLRECNEVPFFPGFSLKPENSGNDQPDEFTSEFSLPQHPAAKELESGQVETAAVTLPEGMTLNPSAAAGLEACTPAQARIHSEEFGVGCPERLGNRHRHARRTGSAERVADGQRLPRRVQNRARSPGRPTSSTWSPTPNATASRCVSKVKSTPNETTGQLTTVFKENPEQPFKSLKIDFNRNALTPVANPLVCGDSRRQDELRVRSRARRRKTARSAISSHRLRRARCRSRSASRRKAIRAKPAHTPRTTSHSRARTANSTSKRSRPRCQQGWSA